MHPLTKNNAHKDVQTHLLSMQNHLRLPHFPSVCTHVAWCSTDKMSFSIHYLV